MYGAQTQRTYANKTQQFENDVEMYGAQTADPCMTSLIMFENDVEMYGAQTQALLYLHPYPV